MRRLLLGFSCFLFSATVVAQYSGGGGLSNASNTFTGGACPAPPVDSSISIYYGGVNTTIYGGGYSVIGFNGGVCILNIDSTVSFYKGGVNTSIYGGGHSVIGFNGGVCTNNLDSTVSFYKGGVNTTIYGGGHSVIGFNGGVCVLTIDSTVSIYKGGLNTTIYGGGHSVIGFNGGVCTVPDPVNLYTGGGSAGFAFGSVTGTAANNNNAFVTTIADVTICSGGTVTLTTTGATAWSWSPATGLSNAAIASPIATPSATTTYTVTGSGTVGCRTTVSVTVTVLPEVATTISYPTSVCTTVTTPQNVVIAGLTNGSFTASPAGLSINASSGAIAPNLSTVGNYTVTYTYISNSCSRTTTASIAITSSCASNSGVVEYANIFSGGTGLSGASNTLPQTVCAPNISDENLIYKGGNSNTTSPLLTLTLGACTPNIDITTLIYKGGNSNTTSPLLTLTLGSCAPIIDVTTLIYKGGNSNTNSPVISLPQSVCGPPLGNNFYLGGTNMGFAAGALTNSASNVTGTVVAARSDTTVCPGVSVSLAGRGATNYTWSPITALSNSIIASPVASPSVTTTYMVTGSGGVGCLNTAKVTINVLKDTITTVSYNGYRFDETDSTRKDVLFIYGPINGTFSATPSGLSLNTTTGSFVPGLSTNGIYRIEYNYNKGVCNYTYATNINVTTLPPDISYTTPTILFYKYNNSPLLPTNIGGATILYELMDSLPAGLVINSTTGAISGIPTALVDTVKIRVRAANKRYTYDTTELVLSVKKPVLSISGATLAGVTTTYGTPSAPGSFTAAGQYIIDSLRIDAPPGFEVSTSSTTGFSPRVAIKQTANIVSSSTIYVRLQSTAYVSSYSGNLIVSSTNADTLFLNILSSSVTPASLNVTAAYFQKFYGSPINLGAGSGYFSSTGLMNSETIGSVTITPSGGTAALDPVGYYTTTPSAATGGTFTPSNYDITYTSGQFQVMYSLYNFQMTGNSSNWVVGKIPAPRISNIRMSNISYTTATFSANVSASYVNIIRRGVCWGTSANPTVSGSKIIDGATTTGSLSAGLTGLTQNTTYYIRGFVTVGTKNYYSNNLIFKTLKSPQNSLLLSSASQYLTFAKSADFNAAGDFTFETWINFNTIGAGQMDPIFGGGQADYFSLYYGISTRINVNNPCGGDRTFSTTALATGTWYHMAMVRVGDLITCYVNGNSVGTTNCTGTFLNSLSTVYIGKNTWRGGYLNAYITNMRYVVGTAVYTSNFTPPSQALTPIAGTKLLMLAESADNPFKDSSPNNITITPYGSPVFTLRNGPF